MFKCIMGFMWLIYIDMFGYKLMEMFVYVLDPISGVYDAGDDEMVEWGRFCILVTISYGRNYSL